MTTAVIADDEPHLAAYLRSELAKLWPELQIVRVARNGVEAAAAIAELHPDLAFLDIKMPGLTGLEVAQGIEGSTAPLARIGGWGPCPAAPDARGWRRSLDGRLHLAWRQRRIPPRPLRTSSAAWQRVPPSPRRPLRQR